MIQDIAPHRLDNSFAHEKPRPESVFFAFQKGNILVKKGADGIPTLPTLDMLSGSFEEIKERAIYVFSVDERPMFLLMNRDLDEGMIPEDLEYGNPRELYQEDQKWAALAGVTAGHLNHWYAEHVYCGCCGSRMDFGTKERAMVCPKCGNIQYPRISPVVMAAVTDGDKLLVTRYAGRPYKGLALIAGFVEIGESLEGALKREVMEEVGLEIKNPRYFGSQPWGFSDSVISGFFAELDGSGQIRLDRDELSEALWLSRDEIPPQDSPLSITAAMIEAFREKEF